MIVPFSRGEHVFKRKIALYSRGKLRFIQALSLYESTAIIALCSSEFNFMQSIDPSAFTLLHIINSDD